MTSNIKCEKCGQTSDGWIIAEEVCIGQDEVSVKCKCNSLGCGNIKQIFLNIEEIAEDFN
jgi:hypothetical protein